MLRTRVQGSFGCPGDLIHETKWDVLLDLTYQRCVRDHDLRDHERHQRHDSTEVLFVADCSMYLCICKVIVS